MEIKKNKQSNNYALLAILHAQLLSLKTKEKKMDGLVELVGFFAVLA